MSSTPATERLLADIAGAQDVQQPPFPYGPGKPVKPGTILDASFQNNPDTKLIVSPIFSDPEKPVLPKDFLIQGVVLPPSGRKNGPMGFGGEINAVTDTGKLFLDRRDGVPMPSLEY